MCEMKKREALNDWNEERSWNIGMKIEVGTIGMKKEVNELKKRTGLSEMI